MTQQSAGILMYRRLGSEWQVMLVHPGGPFWVRKDVGAWMIPKGEIDEGEDPFAAARRELQEETGATPEGNFRPLKPVKQKGGKLVHAWAIEADWDPETLRSNTFEMEYPPRSGRHASFPEVDRAEWFSLAAAVEKILPAQRPLLDELATLLPG